MAIRIPGKLVFLHHPRTGGSATSATLKKLGGHQVGDGQHSYAEAAPGELTFCTIRNPYDVLASWFVLQRQFATMGDFLLGFEHNEYMRRGRLFYFSNYSDVRLLYESLQDDFNVLMVALNLRPMRIHRINTTSGKKPFMSYYDASTIALVEQKFSKDLSDYRDLK